MEITQIAEAQKTHRRIKMDYLPRWESQFIGDSDKNSLEQKLAWTCFNYYICNLNISALEEILNISDESQKQNLKKKIEDDRYSPSVSNLERELTFLYEQKIKFEEYISLFGREINKFRSNPCKFTKDWEDFEKDGKNYDMYYSKLNCIKLVKEAAAKKDFCFGQFPHTNDVEFIIANERSKYC
jgi:hypothetical protein